MPELKRICGPSDSPGTPAISSRCRTRLQAELQLRSTLSRSMQKPRGRTSIRTRWDYILRGRAVKLKPPSRETRAQTVSLFEHALRLAPNSVSAQSWLATELAARALDFMTDSAAADIVRAESLAERALAASPRSSLARFAKGQVLRAQHRYREAIPEYETAIALNRNWAYAYSHVGWCK